MPYHRHRAGGDGDRDSLRRGSQPGVHHPQCQHAGGGTARDQRRGAARRDAVRRHPAEHARDRLLRAAGAEPAAAQVRRPARCAALRLGQSVRPRPRPARGEHLSAHGLPGQVRDHHPGLPRPRGRGGQRDGRRVRLRPVGSAEAVPRAPAGRRGRVGGDPGSDRARHRPVAAAALSHRPRRAGHPGPDQLRAVRQPGGAREHQGGQATGRQLQRLPRADRAAGRVQPAVQLRLGLRARLAV